MAALRGGDKQGCGELGRRYIRLREFEPHSDISTIPPDDYLSSTDGSLPKKAYRIRTDADGFIITGNDVLPTEPAILAIGDSVLENYWIDEKNRICSRLELAIRDKLSLHVRILNAGVTGSNLLNIINSTLTKGLQQNLIGILVHAGPIDAVACAIDGGYWTRNLQFSPFIEPGLPSGPPPAKTDDPIVEPRMKLLQVLAAIADIHGIPIWFATYPYRTNDAEPWVVSKWPNLDRFRAYAGTQEAINQSTRRFCRDHNKHLIDVADELKSRSGILYDLIHPNAEGCHAISEVLYEGLRMPLLMMRDRAKDAPTG